MEEIVNNEECLCAKNFPIFIDLFIYCFNSTYSSRNTYWVLKLCPAVIQTSILHHWTKQAMILLSWSLYSSAKVKVTQSCLTPCGPMDYTVHGILQVRILEWVAIPFSRVSSQLRDPTGVSHSAGRFFTIWVTREATNYSSENLRTTGRDSIAAKPFGDEEKILSVFLVLDINPTVSHSTNASCIPSPEGSASSTLSRAVNTVMKGTWGFFFLQETRSHWCCPWKSDALTGSPAQPALVLWPAETTCPFRLTPYL